MVTYVLVEFCFVPPTVGGLDLGSDNSGCARLGGSKVTPPLGVVEEKVVVVVCRVFYFPLWGN